MFTLFILTAAAITDDELLVKEWFTRYEFEWRSTERRCEHVAILFSDRAWLDLTISLSHEVGGKNDCVAVWYWPSANESVTLACAPHVPCFRDPRTSTTAHWGTRAYFNKIAHRMAIMGSILNQLGDNVNRSIALIDSDVAILRGNPLARMSRLAPNATFIVQQEWPCTTAPVRLCANAGVWLVRRTSEGRRLLGRVTALMRSLALPDQDALEAALAEKDAPNVHYLDRAKFANGYTVQTNASWRREAAHLVHANWLPNLKEKQDFLARMRRK
jgi:hypothetical protein